MYNWEEFIQNFRRISEASNIFRKLGRVRCSYLLVDIVSIYSRLQHNLAQEQENIAIKWNFMNDIDFVCLTFTYHCQKVMFTH